MKNQQQSENIFTLKNNAFSRNPFSQNHNKILFQISSKHSKRFIVLAVSDAQNQNERMNSINFSLFIDR